MRAQDKIKEAYAQKINSIEYSFVHYKQFDYNILKYIYYLYVPGMGRKTSYNDVIIMIDTETSKKQPDTVEMVKGKAKWTTSENHIVAWTISIRAFNHNIVTLYGRKPSKMAETILRIHEHMSGQKTVYYCHNLSYDYIFLRKFFFSLYGNPVHQLNVKAYYPIYVEFDNGIILKDSLILAQRKLEKWASDLGVQSQKLSGNWDYDLIRNQSTPLNDEEKAYIEHDTLAGVECIDALMQGLNKHIYSIPYTATGVPREQTRKRGKVAKAHEQFLKMALTLTQYKKWLLMFHGGYTHGNRAWLNQLITGLVKCFDFTSSYPYSLLAFKYPMEKFTPIDNCDMDFILDQKEDYAFAFKFVATRIRLKSNLQPMPALQFSKALKTINAVLDNGRILCADYVEIYLTEWDLAVIADQYDMDSYICADVEFAKKEYLPRWYTDYIFEAFTNKQMLKGGDAVLYAIAKSIANSLYGLTVQRSIQSNIIENYMTGEFLEAPLEDEEAEYQKYLNKIGSILPYQWGVECTSIAFYNVHQLAKCCYPYYMDTDSCYGSNWDLGKVEAYNQGCKDRLIANGYGAVVRDGIEYWLGTAVSDGAKDEYTEFKYMGAKRYCGRCVADGKLHLTVAGVPKEPGALCLSDDINNFSPGFIFDGTKTGKKTHVYFTVDEIYTDSHGNETGDSISLIPCDYQLDTVPVYNWEELFYKEVEIQTYDIE